MKRLLLFLAFSCPFFATSMMRRTLIRPILPSGMQTNPALFKTLRNKPPLMITEHGEPAAKPTHPEQDLNDSSYEEPLAGEPTHPEQDPNDSSYEGPPETLTSLNEECSTLPEFFHDRKFLANASPDRSATFLTYPRILKLAQDCSSYYTQQYNNSQEWIYSTGHSASNLTTHRKLLGELNNSGLPMYYNLPFPFVQKITCSPTDRIINIGDLHGSLHALIRILTMLYAKKLISNELVLAPTTKLIFNGDLTDRGAYGTEVCYIAFLLKLRNPQNVFIIAGNHENFHINNDGRGGFSQEFNEKFPAKTPSGSNNIIQQLYRYLPLAVYAEINTPTRTRNSCIQYCHGGFPQSFKPRRDFLRFTDKQFYCYKDLESERIPQKNFNFSIFSFGDIQFNKTKTGFSCCNRQTDFTAENTEDVSSFFSDTHNVGVDALIRGHQDVIIATKVPIMPESGKPTHSRRLMDNLTAMLQKSRKLTINKNYHIMVNGMCSEGNKLLEKIVNKDHLHDWRDAAAENAHNFSLANIAVPIITCSTAIESQLIYEISCLLTQLTDEEPNSWQFEPLTIDFVQSRQQFITDALATTSKISNPSRLFSSTTAHSDGTITIHYSSKKPQNGFFDETLATKIDPGYEESELDDYERIDNHTEKKPRG